MRRKKDAYYRTPEQLREAAWEAYEQSMHEYLEIKRLWREWKATRGGGPLSRMKFMAQHTIKDAIEEQEFSERLTIMHTAMYKMESDWQREMEKKREWQQQQEAALD